MNFLKTLSSVLVLTVSITSFAQIRERENNLRRISDETNQMVQAQADNLGRNSRQQIAELLRQVQNVIRTNSQGPGIPGGQMETQIAGPVSRRTGGEILGVALNRQGQLRALQVRSLGNTIKIYQASVVLQNGQRVTLNSSALNAQLGQGAIATFDVSPVRDRAVAVEILAESWAAGISIEVSSIIENGGNNGGPILPPIPQPPPQPQINSYYCMAACKKSDGTANLTYVGGANGTFRSEAEANAVTALQRSWNCGSGVTISECSPEYSGNSFSSIAACLKSSGETNLSYVGEIGTGISETESKVSALKNLSKAWNCGSGQTIYETSSAFDNRPSYCVAACADSTGAANMSYSKGAAGNSLIEAKSAALKELQRSWNCGNGVVISSCESK